MSSIIVITRNQDLIQAVCILEGEEFPEYIGIKDDITDEQYQILEAGNHRGPGTKAYEKVLYLLQADIDSNVSFPEIQPFKKVVRLKKWTWPDYPVRIFKVKLWY